MKKLLAVFVFLLSISLLPKPGNASHVAALDLTITNIGGNDYIIRLAFYRDCSGINAPSTAAFVIQCTSNPSYSFNVTGIQQAIGSGQEVTPICPTWQTRCTGGSLYGLQEYVYEVQVTLPPCNHWRVGWSGSSANLNGLCCRNPSNTVSNPTGSRAYIEATLNNQDAPGASLPSLSNVPSTALCANQTTCVNLGAQDPDGDSLSYSMVTPFQSATSYLNWIPPYTAQQPFPSLPPISLDPVTGNLCMSPTMNIVSPMAVRIDKWREINGVPTIIGTMYRDMQVVVDACNNQLPRLSGMDTTMTKGYDPADTTYYMEVCLGETVAFAMWGYDPDVPNPMWGDLEKFSIEWNNGIPQGTFQTYHQNTDSAYATFIWTPSASHVSNTPRCFTATIKDGACPYFGVQSYSYCITVRGMEVNIGNDTLLCHGESVTFKAIADTTTVNYIWRLDGVPTGTPLSDSTYTLNTSNLAPGLHTVSIETNDGGTTVLCPGTDQVVVNVVPVPEPDLGNDTLLCEPETITLDAGPGAQYLWNTGAITQTVQVGSTGTYYVIVDGGQGTRCLGNDSIYIEIVPMPYVNLGADTCATQSFDLYAGVPNAYYTWSTGETTEFITPTQSGVYSVTVTHKPGSGCERSDSKVVNIVNVDLGPDQTICNHEHIVLEAPIAPAGHSYTYLWLPDGQTTSYITIRDKPVGTYVYSVDVGGGCTDEITITIEYCPITIPNVFTPNGDGINDVFEIDGIDNYPGSRIIIYNRWGQKVYESDSYTNAAAWDARNHSDGVYYYVLYVNDGQETVHHGSVTVMR